MELEFNAKAQSGKDASWDSEMKTGASNPLRHRTVTAKTVGLHLHSLCVVALKVFCIVPVKRSDF